MKRMFVGACFIASLSAITTAQVLEPSDVGGSSDVTDAVVPPMEGVRSPSAPEEEDLSDSPAQGGDATAPPPSRLWIFGSGAAWDISLIGAEPASSCYLYVGLPDVSNGLSFVDLGYLGGFHLAMSYPTYLTYMADASVHGTVRIFIARPNPFPPQLEGYLVALQAVEVVPTITYIGSKPVDYKLAFRPSERTELVLSSQ